MKLIHLVICATALRCAYCQLVPFIRPCHATDVGCLKYSAQQTLPTLAAGLPELGIGSLDPLIIDEIKTNEAGLSLVFKNTLIRGLRNCVVMDLKRSNVHHTFLKIRCSVVLLGDYSLRGRLLVLPIEGDGKYKIVIRNIIVNVDFNTGEREEGGKKFWVIKNWTHSFEEPSFVYYLFQNLFNGDRKLAEPVQQFTNENWKDVFAEVAPPVVKAIVSRVVQETTKLFDKVPSDQLELI